jgi:hypothetical protein
MTFIISVRNLLMEPTGFSDLTSHHQGQRMVGSLLKMAHLSLRINGSGCTEWKFVLQYFEKMFQVGKRMLAFRIQPLELHFNPRVPATSPRS